MSNHLHMIVSAGAEQSVANIIRDFKKFTGKRILAELEYKANQLPKICYLTSI